MAAGSGGVPDAALAAGLGIVKPAPIPVPLGVGVAAALLGAGGLTGGAAGTAGDGAACGAVACALGLAASWEGAPGAAEQATSQADPASTQAARASGGTSRGLVPLWTLRFNAPEELPFALPEYRLTTMTGSMTEPTARRTASPFSLLRSAIGGPRALGAKARRARRTVGTWLDASELERRLCALEARGYIPQRPSRWQLAFGSLDMLRFVIVPFSRDYYEQQGIDFRFHQILRFLDDPVSIIDPTGLLSERDTIIGHLMQVVHLNPIYDLQLLQMFPDGLAELEQQVADMVAGTHPRAETIGAIVEDATYHGRLLGYVRRYRAGDSLPDLVRESRLRSDPHAAAAERTFATLPGYVTYCLGLPRSPLALALRYRSLQVFPLAAEVRDPGPT